MGVQLSFSCNLQLGACILNKGLIVKIRRFVGKDMHSALAQIKEELGVDAVIMSNKKIPEGVELMAAVDYSQSVPDANTENQQENNGSREVLNDVRNFQKKEMPKMKDPRKMISKEIKQEILRNNLIHNQVFVSTTGAVPRGFFFLINRI